MSPARMIGRGFLEENSCVVSKVTKGKKKKRMREVKAERKDGKVL